jgi:hypothetical protein
MVRRSNCFLNFVVSYTEAGHDKDYEVVRRSIWFTTKFTR